MMDSERALRKLLKDLKAGKLTTKDAFEMLKDLPYQDLGFAKVDHHRVLRKGFPEVIYCEGKTPEQILEIASQIMAHGSTLIATRAKKEDYLHLKESYPKARFDEVGRIISIQTKMPPRKKKGLILIITGGTSDIPVAREAEVVARVLGNRVKALYDVGVAGIHRLLDKRAILKRAKVIIVVAGMEGALASVVAGLVRQPVIAVPTSCGYGASFEGIAPLLTMLNSCAPGVVCVNIDNGFGAGYFASLINR